MRNFDLLAMFVALIAWGEINQGVIGMLSGWSFMTNFVDISPSKLYHISWYVELLVLSYLGWRLLGSSMSRKPKP